MRVTLAQINPTVGALDANAARITEAITDASSSDLIVFPELCVCGYPPRDLLMQGGFVEACESAAESIGQAATSDVTVIIGTPFTRPDGRVANGLIAYRDGREIARYAKRLLPSYDVFDEDRYFVPGDEAVVIEVAGVPVGLSVCEDLWHGADAGFASRYDVAADPVADLVNAGARTIINASASPFVLGKWAHHVDILRDHARKHAVPVLAVNQVGGNDDLIFDGRAAAVDGTGALIARGQAFEEGTLEVVCDAAGGMSADSTGPESLADEHAVWCALTLGTRDYLAKTGFRKAIIGLSGGVDSALTAAIAAAALGPDNVLGVRMPGKYSSDHSLTDAADLADRLGIRSVTVPIEHPFSGFAGALNDAFTTLDEPALGASLPDLTEENLQSRVRGTVVMSISNRTGGLVLTTGNKSEFAVGYSTLYGDMNGGLAVLCDVPKTLVYRLARWVNEHHGVAGLPRPPIPASTIEKPPSAELAPGQRDEDSLPPYPVLDRVIELFVDERRSVDDVVRTMADDLDEGETRRVCALIKRNEYKRRQAAVGLKITRVAFGPGRRMPIARG